MKERRDYASALTKEYLISLGITEVTPDGKHIFRNGEELKIKVLNKKKGYVGVILYGKRPNEEENSYIDLYMHVANYVWNKGDRKKGLIVDHIDNNPINNDISNLQLITQSENLAKNIPGFGKARVRMPKYITLEKIQKKLAYYTELYEQAKRDHDAERCHALRSNVGNWKSKLRQYLECPEKYKKPE